MLKLKLFAVAAFLALAAGAFLFPGNRIEAQSGEKAAKRDEILNRIAAYKTWKEVRKPEKKADPTEPKTEPFSVADAVNTG